MYHLQKLSPRDSNYKWLILNIHLQNLLMSVQTYLYFYNIENQSKGEIIASFMNTFQ